MIACLLRDRVGDASPGDLIETIARACSPRVEPHGPDAVLFDADGLARVCGPPDVIAREVTALAASQSIAMRIARIVSHGPAASQAARASSRTATMEVNFFMRADA